MTIYHLDPLLGIRLTCECCGYPTRGVLGDRHAGFLFEFVPRACLLCEWENAPVGDDGMELATAPSPEERNGGYSLELARANFARFLSMYDPEVLEPWMLEPPSKEELAQKAALRAAYADLLASSDLSGQLPVLERIGELEVALERSRQLRAAEAEAEQDDTAA